MRLQRGLLLALLLSGCHADEDSVYKKVFPCTTTAPDPRCGTSVSGEPMMCFAGQQLGSDGSCVEQCASDSLLGVPDAEGKVCLSPNGARVLACKPSGAVPCPQGLSCYRTDVLADEGVCLAIRVCSDDRDCTDPVRSSCLSGVLQGLFPKATLQTGNLHCLQAGCKARGAACPPGESCLPLLFAASTNPPDVCVPACDSNLNCPPNFVCARRVSGDAAVNVCIGGIMGWRCTSDVDCLMGECVDTGAGFSMCSTRCQEHRDCLPWGDEFGQFTCVKDVTGQGKHCVSHRPFGGSPCLGDSFCSPGLSCFYFSIYEPNQTLTTGQCRLPCNDDGSCPARGGVPHVCLIGNGERSCYPGRFGFPCTDTSQCLADLPCLPVPEDPSGARICSIPCTVDADCDVNPYTDEDGYCEAGLCRLGFGPTAACTRDAQCRTSACTAGTCALR